MLRKIEIAHYQKVELVSLDLPRPVTFFFGPNEGGKSSLKEAIAFAINGKSPRVSRKMDLPALVTRGKKNGVSQVTYGASVMRREIKSGKLTSPGSLDLNDMLVDIQLGWIPFSAAVNKDGKAVRDMLNEVLAIQAPEKIIRKRLAERGVLADIIDGVLPKIKAGGFNAAEEHAKSVVSARRGAWEEITGEAYGVNKAEGWEPLMAAVDKPVTPEELANAEKRLRAALKRREDANTALARMGDAMKLQETYADLEDVPALEEAVTNLEELLEDHNKLFDEQQQEHKGEAERQRGALQQLESTLQLAKQSASTLECPSCGTALHIKTKENTSILVKAENAAKAAPAIQLAVAAVAEAREKLDTLNSDHDSVLTSIRTDVTDTMGRVSNAKARLEAGKRLATQPHVTEDEMNAKAGEYSAANEEYDQAQQLFVDLSAASQREGADQHALKKKRAAELHRDVLQWLLVQNAMSSDSDSIQAEIAVQLIRPINTTLAEIAAPWDQIPIALDPATLELRRTDNDGYNMLSESAQWRADAMMQLTLAKLSKLKLVILDRFDVLDAKQRGDFMVGLDEFVIANPGISVVVLGTLSRKLYDALDKGFSENFTYHWIEQGRIGDAQPEETTA